MAYEFTPEELRLVMAFVNDEGADVLNTDAASRFMNISAAFSAKVLRAQRAEKRRVATLTRVNERMKARLETRALNDEYAELDFDSLDVALCIVYLIKENRFLYTRERVQYLLYEAYSRWLADHKERITFEHPVAQEWGPHFWHISKKCGKVAPVVSVENYKAIASRNPGLVKFLNNVVCKYADYSDADFKANFLQSVPYRNAMAKPDSHNPEDRKWGRQIKDSDIFAWKR